MCKLFSVDGILDIIKIVSQMYRVRYCLSFLCMHHIVYHFCTRERYLGSAPDIDVM